MAVNRWKKIYQENISIESQNGSIDTAGKESVKARSITRDKRRMLHNDKRINSSGKLKNLNYL